MADRISAAATGPHRAALAAGVKARTSSTPDIVIGGARPKLRGGAGPRDLVYGNEFGSPGTRESIVNRELRRGRKRRGVVTATERSTQAAGGKVVYRRHATRQFKAKRPFVFPTLARDTPEILDGYARIVDDVLEEL